MSAFDIENALVLGYIEVDDKSNEIPAVERLIGELGLAGCVVTVDAMHCQKNLPARRQEALPADCSGQPTLFTQPGGNDWRAADFAVESTR